MELRNLLVALPVALAAFLIFGYTTLYAPVSTTEKHVTELAVRPPEGSSPLTSSAGGPPPVGSNTAKDSETCSCPTDTLTDDCRNTAYPVMGGLDFVQYFTTFKNADGTYDETQVGSVGSSQYSFVFNGYTFYFLSQENLDIFSLSPESYIPQYGGFCSWGVSGEVCPPYAWSAECLGPNGSYSHWTMVDGKLYFFKSASPKSKFLASSAEYVAAGDAHWTAWFDEKTLEQFSTQCYST